MKKLMISILLFVPYIMYAQGSDNRITKDYQDFISTTGIFVKYSDVIIPSISLDDYISIDAKIRTVWGQEHNTYFLILEKSSDTKPVMIEYTDLKEINRAYAKLLNEVTTDYTLQQDYLESKFTTNYNSFSIGYYVKKKKIHWYIRLNNNKYDYYKYGDLAKNLLTIQTEIEKIISFEGK